MRKIKNYENFINEEFSQDFVDLIVNIALISTGVSIIGYGLYNYNYIESKLKEKVKENSTMKKISLKLFKNDDFQKLIRSKDIENLSAREMREFRIDIENFLDNILTEEEFNYVFNVIDEILSDLRSQKSNRNILLRKKEFDFVDGKLVFNEYEKDILLEYGFTPVNKSIGFIDSSLHTEVDFTDFYKKDNIEIYKMIDSGKRMYRYTEIDTDYESMSGFDKIKYSFKKGSPIKKSKKFEDLEECLKEATRV
jgi:hypothetical protein